MELKYSGAYYTPQKLADFIVKRVYELNLGIKKILEPSCGDGVFLNSIDKLYLDKDYEIIAVEKNLDELTKVQKTKNLKLVNENYLKYHFENKEKFDLVIGNPPYVNKQYITEEDLKLSSKILQENNVKVFNVNLWITFVVSSISKLNDKGILALVLPAEILLTHSSSDVRKILAENFMSVEIIAFKEIVFQNIQQDTVVIIATKKSEKSQYTYMITQNIESLCKNKYDYVIKNGNKIFYNEKIKWSRLFLTEEENCFLEGIEKKILKISDFCKTAPGVVTAANSYFIVNKETVEKYKMFNYTKKILRKCSDTSFNLEITDDYFEELIDENKDCFLLDFNELKIVTEPIQSYLNKGIESNLEKRFKCRSRDIWYKIPNISKASEIIFFKRNGDYPKLLKNSKKILVTDSAYKVMIEEKIDPSSFVFSFYNLITFIFSELNGRFYSGGVLELTPSEFRGLPFPYKKIGSKEYSKLKKLYENRDMEKVLKYTNNIILKKHLEMNDDEIKTLYEIWNRLKSRRLKKIII